MTFDDEQIDVFLTVGDRQPTLQATLLAPNGTPVDLTGATIVFSMASMDGTVEGLGGTAQPVGSPTLGVVAYAWQTADTAAAGHFRGEWIGTFADGRQMTFPNDCPIRIRIRERV